MGRLTEKDGSRWQLKNVPWEALGEGQVITRDVSDRVYGALCKLKDYEDTEKTPDEIELLKYHHHEQTTDEKSGEAVSIMEETQEVDRNMNLTINHSSMQPVYEQIVSQIKDKIVRGELIEETMLPSVRTLAKNIRVSALTVKKAYDQLEAEGFVMTVHGKGSYVACASQARMLEKKKKEVETEFEMHTCNCTGCRHDESDECMHCMRAYSDCYEST